MKKIIRKLAAVCLTVAMAAVLVPAVSAQTAFAANTYTVTFESNGGSHVDQQIIDEGGYVTQPEAPEKSGWEFNGWFTDPELTTTFSFGQWGQRIYSDTTIYAGWTGRVNLFSYDATFQQSQAGGKVGSASIGAISTNGQAGGLDGKSVTILAAPETGYHFVKWVKDSPDGATVSTSAEYTFTVSEATNKVTYYAIFELTTVPTYTVSFESNGGSTIAPQTVSERDYAVKPSDPEKSGWMFDGWYEDEACTKPFSFSMTAITSDVKLYASWLGSINLYSYDATNHQAEAGGKVGSGINISGPIYTSMYTTGNEGKSVTLLAAADAGYHFVKWVKDSPDGETVSTDAEYTFTFTGAINWYALFEEDIDISSADVTGVTDKTYNGEAQIQTPVVTLVGNTLTEGTDYTVSYADNTDAGTATMTVTGTGIYIGAINVTFTINPAANPMALKAKPKPATVKYSKLKKKAQTLAVTKLIKTTTDAKGKKTYALSSAKKGKKSFKKYFKINKTTGKVTVKKGLKKGTYSVRIKVVAAGDANYEKLTSFVTAKVKVK